MRGMPDPQPQRLALGLSYRGTDYHGWQSQPDGRTLQDRVEAALGEFAATAVRTVCAGRTDSGVHALNQVLHFDAPVQREAFSWVRGTNRYLERDIALQWCQPVAADFHARRSALGRRYRYLLLQSAVRPALEQGLCGWSFKPLDGEAMRAAAALLIGEHDFSSFRAAECQALSPVKTMRGIRIEQRGAYWRFDFDASAFLHHMVRNLMGSLVHIGVGNQPPEWLRELLAGRDRTRAAPTFDAAGLYLTHIRYPSQFALAETSERWPYA